MFLISFIPMTPCPLRLRKLRAAATPRLHVDYPLGIRRVQQPRTDRFLRRPQSRLAHHPVRGAPLRAPAGVVCWGALAYPRDSNVCALQRNSRVVRDPMSVISLDYLRLAYVLPRRFEISVFSPSGSISSFHRRTILPPGAIRIVYGTGPSQCESNASASWSRSSESKM